MKRVLILGGDGFIGSAVKKNLESQHDVYTTSLSEVSSERNLCVDLLDLDQVSRAVHRIAPQVVINCAGIVANNETAQGNVAITQNLLKSLTDENINPERVVLLGSASEYGHVKPDNLPVSETDPILPNSPYADSKAQEVAFGQHYARDHNISLIVARLFNPIGNGMNRRMLLPNLIRQVKEAIQDSSRPIIVNRLDAKRDFVDVRDVAQALALLAMSVNPKHVIYNVGSGKETSVQDLVDAIKKHLHGIESLSIVQNSKVPEDTVASMADIRRIKTEFDWEPKYSIDDSVTELINE